MIVRPVVGVCESRPRCGPRAPTGRRTADRWESRIAETEVGGARTRPRRTRTRAMEVLPQPRRLGKHVAGRAPGHLLRADDDDLPPGPAESLSGLEVHLRRPERRGHARVGQQNRMRMGYLLLLGVIICWKSPQGASSRQRTWYCCQMAGNSRFARSVAVSEDPAPRRTPHDLTGSANRCLRRPSAGDRDPPAGRGASHGVSRAQTAPGH